MSDPKVTAAHRRRSAAIYVRQSTLLQVEHNRESTLRQYDLVERAVALGWPRPAIVVIDADLGVSGSGRVARSGFASLIEQIALGQIGIVLALEASRLARNNAEWYRLLDLAAITDTLIGDGDSVYHPGMFDDRLLLGLKGTMSECELQVLRARMLGGLRNKAARGELRVALPIGLVWGQDEGQVLLDPDEAVRGAIGAVFEQFAVCGSARGVWLWLREQGLALPSQRHSQRVWTSATNRRIRDEDLGREAAAISHRRSNRAVRAEVALSRPKIAPHHRCEHCRSRDPRCYLNGGNDSVATHSRRCPPRDRLR